MDLFPSETKKGNVQLSQKTYYNPCKPSFKIKSCKTKNKILKLPNLI